MGFLRKYRTDLLLILALVLISVVLLAARLSTRQAGGEAVVALNGAEIMRLPLDRDTQVLIGEGNETNLLVIENGAARISEADCPDRLCVKQGQAKYDGDTIVCLPHKLIVTIEGGAQPLNDATAR